MALHRDIYWLGRQWAVTGYGIQACDQKQKGQFDIEAHRIWEDGLLDGVRALPWLNGDDFENAVTAARKQYPEPPRKAPAEESAPLFNGNVPTARSSSPAIESFAVRAEGLCAKLTPIWRIRIRTTLIEKRG
jgi:hypothetical protein